jgi:ribose-phosphate pyrophosphokinase
MKILNLASKGKSDIDYEIIKFSDSQTLLELISPKALYFEEEVIIKSRMDWSDIQLIIQAVNILRSLKVQSLKLYIPYLLGARSDRRFSTGQSFYLKEVTAAIINNLDVDEVHILDTHSIASDALIDDFKPIVNNYGIEAVRDILIDTGSNTFIVSPDEGANKRVDNIARVIPHNRIIRCTKDREISTGRILGVTVHAEKLENRPCIILDDICDGGRTFVELAKALKAKGCGELHLVVTHGIFSKGFDELFQYFTTIWTTDSVKNFEPQKGLIVQNVF